MTSAKLLVLFGLAAMSAIAQSEYDSKVWPKLPRWLRCGLPRCSEKLPEDVQAELKKIWANYVEGEECTAEREATKKYISTLPEDVKAIVRPKGHHRWCRAPRFIKKLSVELQEKI
uniref:Uncharacterized protein n=1 Tax=Plectus sambesii TaxID=2011161 RepID=A0A914VAA2_9BILA